MATIKEWEDLIASGKIKLNNVLPATGVDPVQRPTNPFRANDIGNPNSNLRTVGGSGEPEFNVPDIDIGSDLDWDQGIDIDPTTDIDPTQDVDLPIDIDTVDIDTVD